MARLLRFWIVAGWALGASALSPTTRHVTMSLGRRDALARGSSLAPLLWPALAPLPAAAAATTTKTGAVESDRAAFDSVGSQAPIKNEKDVPFIELDGGVKVKSLRDGAGDGAVSKGSKVSLQMTGRLLNLNGVAFYNTKNNVEKGDTLGGPEPFVATVGDGSLVPGLERGLLGMRKGEIRRIIVPPALGYGAAAAGVALQPAPTSLVDQQALDSVVKNPRRDATLLFDVKLERVR